MDIQRELDYLRKLNREHSHYLKRYFGFTLKEIAQKIGLSNPMFIMILHRQKKMPEKYQQRFIEVFKEMDIENRTKDFKPTESQLSIRSLNAKIRLDKLAVLLYIVFMVNFPEYLVSLSFFSKTLNKFFV